MRLLKKFFMYFKASGFVKNAAYAKNFPKETKPYPFPEKYFDYNGQRVCYVEVGEGQPIILMHGSFDCLAIWSDNIAALAKHFKVYAFDFPGFGKSERYVPDVSVEEHTRFLEDFIKKFNLEKPHIFGVSMGGSVAFNYALRNKNIDKLVLVSPAGIAIKPRFVFRLVLKYLFTPKVMPIIFYRYSLKVIWNQQFHEPNARTDEIAEYSIFYKRDEKSIERKRFIRSMVDSIRGVLDHSMRKELHKMQVPALIFWGESDHYHLHRHSIWAQKNIPQAQLVTLPDLGHFIMLEASETFNRKTLEYLLGKNEA